MADDQTRIMDSSAADAVAYGSRDAVDLSGTRIGRYRIGPALGRGGGGAVYAAVDDSTGRECALKVLHPEASGRPELVARFLQEIEMLRELDHPNIVRLLDAARTPEGLPYFTMELLEGETIAQRLELRGRMMPDEVWSIIEPVLAALESAHRLGVVHRDLKAANVFVTQTDPVQVKLLDFGIAKLLRPDEGNEGLTTMGTLLGTVEAMAPEQIRCESVGPWTDIYAVGILMYQMLTARMPFHGLNTEELMRAHLEQPVPRPSVVAPVPPALDAIVVRCLQKHAADRFEDVTSLLEALRRALAPDGTREAESTDAPYIAVYVDGEALDEDEAFDLLDEVQDQVTQMGFEVVLEVGTTLLAMRALDGDASAEVDATRAQLEGVVEADAARLVVHAGSAVVEHGELVGGELADLEAWTAAA
jgi:serine/threonine protein kinase